MANLGNTIINGALRVNGKINSSDVISAPSFVGALTGNADTATKLKTARTINGTSFDGSGNITTANWGTARNIGIVNSDGTGTAVTVSVNGSGNINLKLPATIKAALTGNAATATKLATARTINGVSFDGSANITVADSTKLPLTGGTITGELSYQVNSVDAKLANNNLSSGLLYPTTFHIRDKNGNTLNRLECIVNSNGEIGTFWYLRNWQTDGTYVAQKGIKFIMAKDGTLTYNISDADKFRSAISAVNKAGDTLTGNLSYNMNGSTQMPFKVYGGDANGQGISVGAGGATIVGSGESAKACESLLSATTETLWLASDIDMAFITNCQTIGNRVSVNLSTSREFYPNVNNTGTLGKSDYKWNNVYATTFTGNLSGNASTASKAAQLTTARNINGVSFNGTANININKLVCIDVSGQTIDWNTYCYTNGYTEGIWNSASDGGASSFTNLAVSGKSCRIELKLIRFVSTSDYIQIQEQLVGATKTLYRRYCVNGTWTSWVTVSVNGVAANATKLATARTIGVSGVTGTAQSFNGTANIVIPITAVPSTLLTNKSAIKGSEITNDKHWVPSSDASVTNFVSMTAEEYATNASGLATGTIVAITDGVEGYVTTQATSLTCDLPLDL